jgi:CPA2 family monovalent cation:H+ antiporter-2
VPGLHVLEDLVVVLIAAIGVVLLSHRLRVPALVGFLVTGVVIGPSGLGLVSDREAIDGFAEIGIIFLLFTVALEFSLDRMREIGRPFLLAGPVQALGTTLLAGGVAIALGLAPPRAFFIGFLIALSSTAILLKLLADRRELESPQGQLDLSILLFQDLLVVPAMLLVPLLGGTAPASPGALLLRLGTGVLLVAVVFAGARWAMPRLFTAIVRTRVREVFLFGALAACLGLALLTARAGFSMALGAFLAGLVLAESHYGHQIAADVAPFRDVFNSLFFISAGMLLDLGAVGARLPLVALLLVGVWLVKVPMAAVAAFAAGRPLRVALLVGIGLAQVGEFSFILAREGERAGLLAPAEMQLLLAAAILSMAATPVLLNAGPALARRWGGRGVALAAPGVGLRDHVVIVGFGVNGRNLARVLRAASIRYVVLELDGDLVRAAKAAGEPILFGDSTRRDVLEACGIASARVAVFGISDRAAVHQAIRLARELNPGLETIVRTRRVADIDDLYQGGATEVIAEEFETSIEIFNRVLRRYHVPRNIVQAQEKILRGEKYEALRAAAAAVPQELLRALAAGTTDVFRVPAACAADGRRVGDLDLRRRAGATLIAVVRGEESFTNPAADLRLEAGDALVLVGSHAEVERAFDLLGSVSPEPA